MQREQLVLGARVAQRLLLHDSARLDLPAGPAQDSGPGTDFHAVQEGWIALTPIHVDLTRYQALESVASWAEGLHGVPGAPA